MGQARMAWCSRLPTSSSPRSDPTAAPVTSAVRGPRGSALPSRRSTRWVSTSTRPRITPCCATACCSTPSPLRGRPRSSGSSASAPSRPPRKSLGGVACAAMTGTTRELRIRPLTGIPELREGDQLGRLVAETAALAANEVVVISQKAVSKVEGRVRLLAEVAPGERARELAAKLDKDPAMVELVLAESARVVRADRGVLITETKGGWVCANAGIDTSNLTDGHVSLLPVDGDASARRVLAEIESAWGSAPAVVIADSFGRAWRVGQADVAIGCAGIPPVADWRGKRDRQGGELSATLIATADEVASAADLVRDKDSGVPGAVISGLEDLVIADDGPGAG